MLTHAQITIQELIRQACHSAVGAELAGVEDDILAEGGKLPYDELLEALQQGVWEVTFLKHHQHEWIIPEDNRSSSYCCHCMAPGDI